MIPATKKQGWKLSEAQELINAMIPKAAKYGYSIALGGSVLTKGASQNGLDIFLVPSGYGYGQMPVDILMWFASKFGPGKTIGPRPLSDAAGHTLPPPPRNAMKEREQFTHKMYFNLDGRRINVFVV